MVRVSSKRLEQLVKNIFVGTGCSHTESDRIAYYLTKSNLAGHESHGVLRVPRYLHWLKEGNLKMDQDITILNNNDSMSVVDGNKGFGQTIGPQVVDLGIQKAKRSGLALVALRNSGHLGRIGDWGEMAAEEDVISIHFVNTSGLGLLVAPFGGSQRRLSTNPFCIGIPRENGKSLILDFATSIVAEGKVLNALGGGLSLPKNALVDHDGTFSEDPSLIYGARTGTQPLDQRTGSGAIRAMGEHKGSGLSFMCELLAGALTGSGCSKEGIKELINGMLSIYIVPKFLSENGAFYSELEEYVSYFLSSNVIEKDGTILCPGDAEQNSRADRIKNGIPLTTSTWESLIKAAEDVGLSRAEIKSLSS